MDQLDEFLKREDLPIEIALKALELRENRPPPPKPTASPIFLAIISGIFSGGVLTAAIGVYASFQTESFGLMRQSAEQTHSIQVTELAHKFSTFERLISIDESSLPFDENDQLEFKEKVGEMQDERKRRICLAVAVGLIDIERYMLTDLNSESSTKDFSTSLNNFLNKQFGCDKEDGFVPNSYQLASQPISTSADSGYLTPVPIPKNVNQNLSAAKYSTLSSLFGEPHSAPDRRCKLPDDEKLSALIESKSVGPFSVTGLRPALQSLERILQRVRTDMPELYYTLGSAGMTCARLMRGTTKFANHSWGTSLDITIDGSLDGVGVKGGTAGRDGKTTLGLLLLAPYFHEEGWFWGAGSSSFEDGMHFEVSDEKLREWEESGLLSEESEKEAPGE